MQSFVESDANRLFLASAVCSEQALGPLSLWNSYISALTGIEAEDEVAEAYTHLIYHLDTYQFKNKMASDRSLWLSPPSL